MGDFSRDTFDKLKHYVGVRLQQGVPVLDADWNEMEDIRRYELEAFLKWFVGNGVPRGNDGFRILSAQDKIVLTADTTDQFARSFIHVDLDHSSAAGVLGFGLRNCSARRAAAPPAQLIGENPGPFEDLHGKALALRAGDVVDPVIVNFTDESDPAEVADRINEIARDNDLPLTASVGVEEDLVIKGGDGKHPGHCLVEGWDVINESDLNYTAQPLYGDHKKAKEWGVPELEEIKPPPSGQARTDVVYLDVWEREVDKFEDRDHLINEIIDIETCVRVKREWVVRVAQGLEDEEGLPSFLQDSDPILIRDGHVYYPLARLTWTWEKEEAVEEGEEEEEEQLTREISDLRRTGLSVNDNADIDVFLNTLGSRLNNGDTILPRDLLGGLRIELGADVDATTVNQGTCFATVEFPESDPDGQLVGYTPPLALAANAAAMGPSISWQPLPGVGTYLKRWWWRIRLLSTGERLLARLVLKGNLISATAPTHPPLSNRDLERWFWLKPIDAKLPVSDAAIDDCFGYAVAISGDTLVVGAYRKDAYRGAAYVFVRDDTGDWAEVTKLTASNAEQGDYFGCGIAISGDTLVVGAYGKDDERGAAYVFVRNDTGDWTEVIKLTASDAETGDQFGCAVAISGDTLVVGAYGKDDERGAAYVFVRDDTGDWTEVTKLTASDAETGDQFGCAVAISGDTAVIGAQRKVYYRGAAYVFVRDDAGDWAEATKLALSEAEGGDYFGCALAVSGDTLVVGAYGKDIPDANNTGAAYVFVRDDAGNWARVTDLFASDAKTRDHFGQAVAISGDTLVVGGNTPMTVVPGQDEDPGAAYVFVRDDAGDWAEVTKLVASDAAMNDRFGSAVAISGDTLVVGAYRKDAYRGAAYVLWV